MRLREKKQLASSKFGCDSFLRFTPERECSKKFIVLANFLIPTRKFKQLPFSLFSLLFNTQQSGWQPSSPRCEYQTQCLPDTLWNDPFDPFWLQNSHICLYWCSDNYLHLLIGFQFFEVNLLFVVRFASKKFFVKCPKTWQAFTETLTVILRNVRVYFFQFFPFD